MIHAARLDRSPALQRIMAILSDYEPHTSLEIANRAQSVCVGTRISELRSSVNGKIIISDCIGKNENGSTVYSYKLLKEPEAA